jgi:hypothetical protein
VTRYNGLVPKMLHNIPEHINRSTRPEAITQSRAMLSKPPPILKVLTWANAEEAVNVRAQVKAAVTFQSFAAVCKPRASQERPLDKTQRLAAFGVSCGGSRPRSGWGNSGNRAHRPPEQLAGL